MDCQVHAHLIALHSRPGFESVTPGAGLLCPMDRPDLMLAIGVYRNSIAKTSAYAGMAWRPWSIGPVQVGAFGGVVTGYRPHPIPFAAAVASIPAGGMNWHLTMIPQNKYSPLTVGLSVSWSIK